MPTIHDVAKLAHVSVGTVSNYLNGRYVGVARSEAIKNAIEQLRYTPNRTARALKVNAAQQIMLILPNLTEACLLLGRPMPDGELNDEQALSLAQELTALCPQTVVTGVPMGRHLVCTGAGRNSFVVRRLKLERSYPGTGDLFAAVLTGALLRGNALSAATDAAAGFVADSIAATDPEAPTALGVWFEPLLGRLTVREG